MSPPLRVRAHPRAMLRCALRRRGVCKRAGEGRSGTGGDGPGTVSLPARGDRLAEPGSQLATGARGLSGGRAARSRGLLWSRIGRCDSIPSVPDGSNIAALKTALAAAEDKASKAEAEARAAVAVAKVSDAEAEIALLKLTIEKLQREIYGQRSERKQRLLDHLELQLDELDASATEDELAAEKAAAETTQVKGFTRSHTWRPTPASSRPTYTPATTPSMWPGDRPGLSPRVPVGRTREESSSSSPTSRPGRGAARTRRQSRRSRWRR